MFNRCLWIAPILISTLIPAADGLCQTAGFRYTGRSPVSSSVQAPPTRVAALPPRSDSGGNDSDGNDSDEAADKKAEHPQATMNWDRYRDRDLLPIDPRKPNNPCINGELCDSVPMGYRGRPYQPAEPGGCQCGDKKCDRHPEASIYWPRPFSVGQNEKHPRLSGDSRRPRCLDCFDNLRNFRLVNYTRTDDGYHGDRWGRGRERYGCLGESRHSVVAGVGFRSPGSPVNSPFPLSTTGQGLDITAQNYGQPVPLQSVPDSVVASPRSVPAGGSIFPNAGSAPQMQPTRREVPYNIAAEVERVGNGAGW